MNSVIIFGRKENQLEIFEATQKVKNESSRFNRAVSPHTVIIVRLQCSCHWAQSPARVFQWKEQIQNAWDVSMWSVHNTIFDVFNTSIYLMHIYKSNHICHNNKSQLLYLIFLSTSIVGQLPGIQELHDWHLPTQPPGVPDLHRLPQELGRRCVCNHEVGGGSMWRT